MQFDARAAKQLTPGEHLKIEGCPGLRLEASDSRRTWTYRYRSPIDERMRQIAIGHWPAVSHLAAANTWEGLRKQREAGEDPALKRRADRAAAAESKPAGGVYLVRELCEDYLVGHVERVRKPKGAKEMRRLITSMTATIADKPAEEVTRGDAFDLLESFADIPVTAATLRGELGAAWNHALDAGRIKDTTPNWWRLIMRGKLRSKGKKRAGKSIGVEKRALSEPEVGRLICWLPNFSALVEDAIVLYLWTLTRGAEIVAMEGREISDEEDGLWWTIPKPKTKNARHALATDLRVPLIGRAEVVVRRRLARYGPGYLFPQQKSAKTHSKQTVIGSQVYNHMPYSKVKAGRTLPKLTVTHWAPHDLRRTGRTMLAAMGCPRDIGEAVLGHMLEGVEGVYNRHRYDRERRDWLTKLSLRLEDLAGRPMT